MPALLSAQQMSQLKKVNVSKIPEKTRKRIGEDFKAQTNVNKNAIEKLSGLSRAAIRNAYTSGVASAKTVLALAQTLDISPFYYTGINDEKGSCSKEELIRFLTEYGYNTIVSELQNMDKPQKRKYNRKPKAEPVAQADVDAPASEIIEEMPSAKPQESETMTVSLTLSDSSDMRDTIAKLTVENTVMLINSLFLRAEAGGENAKRCDIVKRILLS